MRRQLVSGLLAAVFPPAEAPQALHDIRATCPIRAAPEGCPARPPAPRSAGIAGGGGSVTSAAPAHDTLAGLAVAVAGRGWVPPGQAAAFERVRSLEVRWFFPGRLAAAVARWFGRFPARTESREDIYLLDPPLPGVSVKVRGGGPVEVKVYRGSPGILEVAGHARGRLEAWQKWPLLRRPLSRDSSEAAAWRSVRKRRRISRFSLTDGQIVARSRQRGHEPGCDVELT